MATPPVPPRPLESYDSQRKPSAPPPVPPLPPTFKQDQESVLGSPPHFEDPLVAPRPHKLQPDLPANVRIHSHTLQNHLIYIFHKLRAHRDSVFHINRWLALFTSKFLPRHLSLRLLLQRHTLLTCSTVSLSTTHPVLRCPKTARPPLVQAPFRRPKAQIGLLGLLLKAFLLHIHPPPRILCPLTLLNHNDRIQYQAPLLLLP